MFTSKTDSALSDKRGPSLPDVGTVPAAHLARALVPFLLGETELLEDQLEETLVFFGRPFVRGSRRGLVRLFNGRKHRIWINARAELRHAHVRLALRG